MTNKGPVQESILDGIHSYFRNHLPAASLKEFNARGPNDTYFVDWFNEATVENVDLLVTIGDRPTKLLVENQRDRRFPIPTVFCPAGKPVRDTIAKEIAEGADYITGVYAEPLDNVFPVQLLIQLLGVQPHQTLGVPKRLLGLYRSDAKGGRVIDDIEQITKYCEARNIVVTNIDVANVKNIADLRGAIQSADGVFMPEAGMTADDVQAAEAICNEEKKMFFADAQATNAYGSIYGFKNDFRYMGVKAAEMACEILLKKKRPGQLPMQKVEHSRKIHNISAETMAKCGVFVADDVIASLEDKVVGGKDVPTIMIGMSCIAQTSYSYGLQGLVYQRMQQAEDAFYHMSDTNGWWENRDFMRKHIKFVANKKDNIEAMLFFDDRMANLVWKEVHKQGGTYPPMVIAAFEDEIVGEQWHEQARAEGHVIVQYIIPKPNPLIQFHMLRESMKNLKRLTLVGKMYPENMPLFMQKRVDIVHAECKKYGIELNICGAFSFGEIIDLTRSLTPETSDAYMFFQDFFCGKVGASLLDRCLSMKVPVCAGGVSYSQISPMGYGVDLLKLREIIFTAVKKAVHGQLKPEDMMIRLPHNQIYAITYNKMICDQLGLTFSPLLEQIITLPRREVMYERNAAACLQAVGVNEEGEPLMVVPKPKLQIHDL